MTKKPIDLLYDVVKATGGVHILPPRTFTPPQPPSPYGSIESRAIGAFGGIIRVEPQAGCRFVAAEIDFDCRVVTFYRQDGVKIIVRPNSVDTETPPEWGSTE